MTSSPDFVQALLAADGIDPYGPTPAQQAAFARTIYREKKSRRFFGWASACAWSVTFILASTWSLWSIWFVQTDSTLLGMGTSDNYWETTHFGVRETIALAASAALLVSLYYTLEAFKRSRLPFFVRIRALAMGRD